MKILFVHNAIAEYRIAFFQELSKLVELDILITEENKANSIYNLKKEIPTDLNIRYIHTINEIKTVIINGYYDIIILPPIDNFYQLRCAFAIILICKKLQKKTIYWTEKWEPRKNIQPKLKRIKNFIQAQLIAFFARQADYCIAAGSKSKAYLNSLGISDNKIEIAFDSSTSSKYLGNINIRDEHNIPHNGKIILYLGRLIKRKGCDILIKSFSKFHSDNLVYLLICGEGNDQDVFKDFIKINDIKNVIFAGKVEPQIRSEFFKQSDVFVLPSYSYKGIIEAWGLTVNESLEQGTPVVVTTAVGAGYDLSDGECCIMVKENDSEDLSKGIKRILYSCDLTEVCKERYNLFNIPKMAKHFYLAFSKII